jgi:hypothetical protein
VFAEGVHRLLQVVRYQDLIALNASATSTTITGYQGRSPCLVSNPNVGGRFAAVRNRGFSRVWPAGWERFEIGSYDRGPIGADAR